MYKRQVVRWSSGACDVISVSPTVFSTYRAADGIHVPSTDSGGGGWYLHIPVACSQRASCLPAHTADGIHAPSTDSGGSTSIFTGCLQSTNAKETLSSFLMLDL